MLAAFSPTLPGHTGGRRAAQACAGLCAGENGCRRGQVPILKFAGHAGSKPMRDFSPPLFPPVLLLLHCDSDKPSVAEHMVARGDELFIQLIIIILLLYTYIIYKTYIIYYMIYY